jgi:hydrogenase 3 maturation protease
MPGIKTILRSRLKGAGKIAILGIGSLLRADDAVGMIIAQELEASCLGKKKKSRLKVFLGETAPENLTGEIKKFKPTHLIVIDAVDFRAKPGAFGVVDMSAEAGVSFYTHRVPINNFRDYLHKCIACETILIGMQPGSTEFCGKLSRGIRKSASSACREIKEVLQDLI